jgi:hypothetical protein
VALTRLGGTRVQIERSAATQYDHLQSKHNRGAEMTEVEIAEILQPAQDALLIQDGVPITRHEYVKNAVNDYDTIFGPGFVPTRYTIALTGADSYDPLQLKNCGGRNQPGIIQMTDAELSEILHPPREVAPIPNALLESIADAHNPNRAQHIYGEPQASVDRHYNQEVVLGKDHLNVIEEGERLAREGLCRLRCRELQRLHISTARFNYERTSDDWLAVGGRIPLLQPTRGDPNYVMMLANLALIMPNRDWIEEYVGGVEAHFPAAGIHEEYERRQAICPFCRYVHNPNDVYSSNGKLMPTVAKQL